MAQHSWLKPKLHVKKSKIHKRGVFAKVDIPKGERLAIFGGDIMLIDEIDSLPARFQEYPMQIEERFVLGSRTARRSEEADFFNHSCQPNSGFKGQIFLVAMRDIRKGEEVTFDYAMVVSESIGSDTVFEMDCSCGSRRCRKRITEHDWQLPDLQSRYDGYFSHYLQERIDHHRAAQRSRRLQLTTRSTKGGRAYATGSNLDAQRSPRRDSSLRRGGERGTKGS